MYFLILKQFFFSGKLNKSNIAILPTYQLLFMDSHNKIQNQKITCLRDYEKLAHKTIDSHTLGYYSAGADDQFTLHNNINAFTKIFLKPRVLTNISNLSLKTKILGRELDLPFGVAPVAMQKLIHPEGEQLLARQAQKENVAYGLSMCSTTRPSDILKVNPEGLKIQQLYILKNTDYTNIFLKAMEEKGFSAVALTVDTQTFGKRRIDERNKFLPIVQLEIFNELGINIKFRHENPQYSFIQNLNNDLSWDNISQMKRNTSMKIILKGIVDPADAIIAHSIGVDAIWISNHGGRQLDTAPSTIEALPPIKKALKEINSKMEIYIDGGIKKGTDIFKCLALGANYVFLGRGLLYSLVDGQKGVQKSFQILKKQLKITMGLCGTKSIEEINENHVRMVEPYSRL